MFLLYYESLNSTTQLDMREIIKERASVILPCWQIHPRALTLPNTTLLSYRGKQGADDGSSAILNIHYMP